MNNIAEIEKSIKRFLKRSKNLSYSAGLLVAFLITGNLAYSEEIVVTEEIIEDVPTREQLGTEIETEQERVQRLINLNEDSIKHLDLSILQLLEQGTQVIKPWDRSWQFGINYWWNRSKNHDKYPYDVKFDRSKNIFVRNTSPISSNYKEVEKLIEQEKKSNPSSNYIYSYKEDRYNDYMKIRIPVEYSLGIAFTPEIKPKIVKREPFVINVENIDIKVPHSVSIPNTPEEPGQPSVKIHSFAPVSPDIIMPPMPSPSNLVFLAYADNNFGKNMYAPEAEALIKAEVDSMTGLSDAEKAKKRDELARDYYLKAITAGTKFESDFQTYHNTWTENNWGVPPDGLTFKTNYIGKGPGLVIEINQDANKKPIYIDSFNPSVKFPVEGVEVPQPRGYLDNKTEYAAWKDKFARENAPKANGYEGTTFSNGYTSEQLAARNSQYFMVGGARGIEFDNSATSQLVPEIKVNMAGPLVFGVAFQEVGTVPTFADVTDAEEKNQNYIKNMPTRKDETNKSEYLVNKYVVKDTSGNFVEKEMLVTKPVLDENGNPKKKSDGSIMTKEENVLLGPAFPGAMSPLYDNILQQDAKFADYRIRKSKDGYVGYKIGVAQIEEEFTKEPKTNGGTIDIRGEKSIGLFAYAPYLKRTGQEEKDFNFPTGPERKITLPTTPYMNDHYNFDELPEELIKRYEKVAIAYNEKNNTNKPTKLIDDNFTMEKLKYAINEKFGLYTLEPKQGNISLHLPLAKNFALINGKGKYPYWESNFPVDKDKYGTGSKEYTGKIKMSGYNSYAMKWSMATSTDYLDHLDNQTNLPKVAFKNQGEIELRKNPDADGVDKADKSIGMALLTDDSFASANVTYNLDKFYKDLDNVVDAFIVRTVNDLPGLKTRFVWLATGQEIMIQAREFLENSLYVSLPRGLALNEGSIKLKDNIANSIGMYVNIGSDMTNKGTIEISADPEVFSNPETLNEVVIAQNNKIDQLMNIGMYAKQVSAAESGILVKLNGQDPTTAVINDASGHINLLGKHSIGMTSEGKVKGEFNDKYKEATAQAINKGKIENVGHDNNIKTKVFGMVAQKEANIINEGTINFENISDGAGMVIKKENPTSSVSATGKNTGKITITGIKSTGIYNEGSFEMSGADAEITVKGKGSMAVYARLTNDNEPTLIKGGTISVSDGALALYPDDTTITLDNTDGNLKINVGKNGLFVYNYASGNVLGATSLGKLLLNTDIDVNIEEGGSGFYIKDSSSAGNQAAVIEDYMTNLIKQKNNTEKLHLKMADHSVAIILDGGKIKTSGFGGASGALGSKVTLDIAPGATGKYSLLSIYRGHMIVDKSANLDDKEDIVNKTNLTSSSITIDKLDASGNNITVEGTNPGQIAFYQDNYEGGAVDKINIINNGKIKLSGNSVSADSSTGTPAKTTTALGGSFITVNNMGDITVSGDNALAIYGNSGSVLSNSGNIELGSGSVGIYAINRDANSEVGNENITITNTGTIKAMAGKTGTFGILAKNDAARYPSATSNIVNGQNSVIDLTEAPNSIGIMAKNTKVKNDGTIKVKDRSTGLTLIDSDLVENGANIELNGNSIAYDIRRTPGVNSTQIFDTTIKLNGDKNTIFLFKDGEVAPVTGNVTIQNNSTGSDPFNYMVLSNATLNMDRTDWTPQTFDDSVVFINGYNSKIKIDNDITLNGDNSVAIYSVKDTPVSTYDVDTAGTINLNRQKSIGIYAGKTGVYNKSAINIGEDNTAIYVSESPDFKNDGAIKLGSNSTGIVTLNSSKFVNNGDITIGNGTGNISKAQGIVINNSSGVVNNAKITLNGQGSGVVGIYAQGNGDIKNSGEINITGNAPTDSKNIGVYVKDNGTKFTNDGKLITGENTVGIYGYNVESTGNSNIEIGKSGIGIVTHDNSTVDLAGTMKVTQGEDNDETIALHHEGKDSDIKINFSSIDLGKHTIGVSLAKKDGNNKVEIRTPNAQLNGESIYVYSVDETPTAGGIHSYTDLVGRSTDNTTGIPDENYGYYVAGLFENHGKIDFSHELGSVGIYSTSKNPNMKPAINSGTIDVAQSDTTNFIYGIGMGAGHIEKDDYGNIISESSGNIVNKGIINVDKEGSIGMYAAGTGSKAVNEGTINIRGKKAMGMYLGKGAVGVNAAGANIEIFPGAIGASAIYLDTGAIVKNYGNITIHEDTARGIFKVVGSTIEANTTNAPVHEHNAMTSNEKRVGSTVITVHKPGENKDTNIAVNGIPADPIYFDRVDRAPTSDYTIDEVIVKPEVVESLMPDHKNEGAIFEKIGMYVDTSGIDFTHPINGNLKVNEADLIIGTEAAEATNETNIIVGDNIFNEYNAAILNNPQVEKWNVLSGSLTWAAAPNRFNGSQILQSVVMTKIKYTDTVEKDSKIYNFMDGMEQRYGMNALDSREKKLFNKLNNIGKNEEVLYKQAVSEMLGRQYVNTFKRVMASHNSFYREFDDLMKWQTETKDTMKVKLFGEHNKVVAKKDRAIGYKRDVQGVFVLNNNETVRLGESSGMFLGMANEQFKFKDMGGSKEKAITGQIGYYKSNAYGYNNELNWTWKAGIEGSHRKMDRRYLVVDDIFHAKSKYHSYGVFLDNTLGMNYRVSEHFTVEPYAGLDMAGGRVGRIHENSGEMRLDIKSKDYWSFAPNAGMEVKYDTPLETKKLVASVDANISREFGNIENAQMKARVNRTTADYYKLSREKREKIDLGVTGRVGLENDSYGVAAKVGYSTVNKALNGGLELRVKF